MSCSLDDGAASMIQATRNHIQKSIVCQNKYQKVTLSEKMKEIEEILAKTEMCSSTVNRNYEMCFDLPVIVLKYLF